MNHDFGPWATLIGTGRQPQLSAFWRRRMTRLADVSRTRPALTWPNVIGLALAGLLLGILSTFHIGAGLADEPAARTAQPPAAPTGDHTALTYSGTVVDKLTGKPIAGAAVTVRRSLLSPSENRVLEEPQYTTDAVGRYAFSIPPEQAADRYLYIELERQPSRLRSAPRIRICPEHDSQE